VLARPLTRTSPGREVEFDVCRVRVGDELTPPFRDARLIPRPLARIEGCTAKVCALCLDQRPFSVTPCQTLVVPIHTNESLNSGSPNRARVVTRMLTWRVIGFTDQPVGASHLPNVPKSTIATRRSPCVSCAWRAATATVPNKQNPIAPRGTAW
jgi:hypothetical protein